ncbi:MAG: glycoside hydrolase family 3 protein [Acidimicrobiales bacterium]|nr:glycoside hydrolase family 3 protein [Acidimicrobiales bacterium]
MGDSADIDWAEKVLAELTLEEKVDLMTGRDLWSVRPVERLGLPALKVTDGPAGARGTGLLGTGIPALCIPCGTALGATWNPDLVEELGGVLAAEARARGSHVLLAPTINLHRTPLGGRNFECMSEDPVLTGRIASGYVQGVQDGGVATTVKHFVANDSEFERTTISSAVDDRTLREISLRPFEMAVTEGGAWGVMSSYNRVNGVYAAEHRWLLTTVLRDEWGFDGVVVSDWFGAKSTADSVLAGLDLEMPGPGQWYGELLVKAVIAGEVPEERIDRAVGRLLRLLERTDALAEPHHHPEKELEEPAHRALVRRAAAEGFVLLKNEPVDDAGPLLPFDPSQISRLAVIGPNAATAMIMGGGSAALVAQHETAPLDAIRDRLGDQMEIVYEVGTITERSVQPIGGRATQTVHGNRGFEVEYFNTVDRTGPVVGCKTFRDGRLLHFDTAPGVTDLQMCSFRASTWFTPVVDGLHVLALVQSGRARLVVDGEVVIDGVNHPMGPGEEFFGFGSAERTAEVRLTSGVTVEIAVEWSSEGAAFLGGVKVGLRTPVADGLMDRAVAAAADADAAVLIVGTNLDWETEGRDRESMDLPGDQPELIRRVCEANQRTVVVINTGSVVTGDWVDVAPSVLATWFGGQEMAAALVDVLVGDDEPSGRLPTTVPQRLADTPAFLHYPGENGQVVYSEGLFTGYRWYEARGIEVAFPFGHGLSYTQFEWGTPIVKGPDAVAELEAGQPVVVVVPLRNTGDRAGSEVVQVYVGCDDPRLSRPVRELRGLAKVKLEPGEERAVELVLDYRAFSYWDPGDPSFVERTDTSPVAAGVGKDRRAEAGWVVDPGIHRIHLGASSIDTRAVVVVELL